MLDEYFHRDDVLAFMLELKTNPKYLNLGIHKDSLYGKCMENELALFLFYDAIIKYKIIIDDSYIFSDFLGQIEKLFRKIDDYKNMVHGINKIIGNFVSTNLDVHDITSIDGRNEVIKYVYDKYIVNGYFVHGFSTVYEDDLKNNDFVSEKYNNNYQEMKEIKDIFNKYKINIMDKDFIDNRVFFTDDIVMGCFYSVTSPGYFYQLLFNEHVYGDGLLNKAYIHDDYNKSILSIKKFINDTFKDNDKKRVLSIVYNKWNHLHMIPKRISLLFVKRNKLMDVSNSKLDDYLNSDLDVYELLNKIFSSTNKVVDFSGTLKKEDYQIVSLECLLKNDNPSNKEVKEEVTPKKMDSFGVISICLIIGSLLITMGVIISIIFVIRGM